MLYFVYVVIALLMQLIFVTEFDALTGSKLASIDVGARVVRMQYSPTSGRTVISILEVSSGIPNFLYFSM